MSYETIRILVKCNQIWLMRYCECFTHLAKLLKNATIYRLRQLQFAWFKNFEELSEAEIEVIDEFKQANVKVSKKRSIPSYESFVKMYTKTKNPDYFNDLPRQCSQQVIKEVLSDFNSYIRELKDYKVNPSKYTGRPKLPSYCKTDHISFDITNQDATIYKNSDGTYSLKLPKVDMFYTKPVKTKEQIKAYKKLTKEEKKKLKEKEDNKSRVNLGNLDLNGKVLKEVTIKPYYNTYAISLVFEVQDVVGVQTNITSTQEQCDECDSNNNNVNNDNNQTTISTNEQKILSIDLGVNNLVTTSNNVGLAPFIINGNGLKAYNQWFNKTIAHLQQELSKHTKNGKQVSYNSERMINLRKVRDLKLNDYYNKSASYIINYCKVHHITHLVIGKTNGWKEIEKTRKENKQNFRFISHGYLIKKLKEMGARENIVVVVREESYTSQSSFLDNDILPTFKKGEYKEYEFSGKRKHRGLYKTKDGILINADVNGASNILRKEYPNAFDNIKDFSYLYKTVNVVKLDTKVSERNYFIS